MDTIEIISLLERPTKNVWPFVYQIRDEAAVLDIAAALRASTVPHIRSLLCYLLNLRSRAEFFEGKRSETRQAVPALIEMLADPDEGVRSEAIDALGHIGDPMAGPALLEEYHKEKDDSGLRILLASTVGFCQYAPAIPPLIEALSSSENQLRRHATLGLRHLQAQEAKEPLRKALAQETDPLTRQAVQETLQELEHPSTREEKIDRLIAQLRSAETTEREAAATALGDMVDARVLAPLLALLHDEQHEVRQYAALALAWLRESRDADWFARAHREQVLEPLIQAHQDQESSVQAAVAQAVGDWGDARAVEPLLALVQNKDREVRRQVVEALGCLRDERALEPLVHIFLTDDDREVRSFAAQGLSGFEDNRAVNALILALQDGQAHIRRNATEMLCWLKDERATDALLLALRDKDQEVREWAIEALWQICLGNGDDLSLEASEKMRKLLTQALQDEDSEVRACADKIMKWLVL
jgi:HEAT repeat protein